MANKSFNRIQARDKEVKVVTGNFTVGTSGTVVSTTGLGFGVTKLTPSGNYRFQLDDQYPKLLSFHGAVQSTNPSTHAVQLNQDVVAASGYADLATVSSGVATNAASGTVFHCTFYLKNTTVER